MSVVEVTYKGNTNKCFFFYVKDLIFLKTKVKYIHNPFDFVDNLPIVKVDTLGIHRKQNMSSVLLCYELRV